MDVLKLVDQEEPFEIYKVLRNHQLEINNNDPAETNCTVKPPRNRLPAVVLHKVFSYLNHQDRINSSEVCQDWREAFLHPGFWTTITFRLGDASKKSQTSFLVDHWAHSVQNATVQSHISLDIYKLEPLLRQFRENSNLKQLFIEPALTTVEGECLINAEDLEAWKKSISSSILEAITSARKLEALSIGCIEPLLRSLDAVVNQLAKHHGKHIIHLGLASTPNDDPLNYQSPMQSSLSFKGFERITTLTLDYEYVNEALLHSLDSGTLERLIVHVHKWSEDHPGTTDSAWQALKSKNQRCELRLNFLHAHTAIKVAHRRIFTPAMPLSHFKALFCMEASGRALYQLTKWYRESLKSVMWIDSTRRHMIQLPTDEYRVNRAVYDILPQNFSNLREFIYFGHYLSQPPLAVEARSISLRIELAPRLELLLRGMCTNEEMRGLFDEEDIPYEPSINGDSPYDFEHLENSFELQAKASSFAPLDEEMIPALMDALRGDTRCFINLIMLKDTK